MRLLGIEFENVNSLAGKWTIDLTAPAFAREGIFAIVGPTGSGKTSILDAISLALYGKTARQEKATKDEIAEVMTRGMFVCSSKVSFCGADGKSYRAEWSMTRKRRKGSDGGVNNPESRLYELNPEKDVTPRRKGEVADLIVEKVGLDFQQFQRSMMLAQGQFDKFLTADDKDRAAILEQATGSDIYTRIGVRIFEKWQAAVQKAKEIELRRGENVPLADEERSELEKKATDALALAKKSGERLKKLLSEKAWLEEDERLAKEKAALDARQKAADSCREALAPEEKSLAAAESARTLIAQHTRLESLRKAKADADKDAADRSIGVAAAEKEAKRLGDDVRTLEEIERKSRERRDAAAPFVVQAVQLDDDVRIAKGEAKIVKTGLEEASAANDRLIRESRSLSESLGRLSAELNYLEALRGRTDADAPEDMDAELLKVAKEMSSLRKQSASELAAVEKTRVDFAASEEAFAIAKAVYDAEQPQIDRRLKDAMRVRDVMVAMDYGEIRAKLRPDDVCPVCGRRMEGASAELPEASEFEKAYDDAVASKKASDEAYGAARIKRDAAEASAKAAEKKLESATARLAELEKALAARETQVKTRINDQTERLKALQKELGESAMRLEARRAALRDAERNISALESRRKGLELPADIGAYSKMLDGAVESAARALSEGRLKSAAAKVTLEERRTELGESRARSAAAGVECSAAETEFLDAIADKGLVDEAAWAAACGDDRALDAIRKKKSELEGESVALKEAREKHDEVAVRHAAEGHSGRSPEEVDRDVAQAEAERSAAERESGDLAARMRVDDDCRRRAALLADELERATARKVAWTRLNNMLGGSEGVRFRQYAQGLTLRALLRAANPFLSRVTGGRYSLLWRPSAPPAVGREADAGDAPHLRKKGSALLPLIVDHDQHDTVRPVSNVSGGERFEVSLALALGLSRLTAGRVKVETMFLDEGFGTLDPERLEAALDVLCSLRGDGTVIGVISHVAAVEDRIPLKIRVESAGGGHGRLRGEGPISGAVR